MQVICWGSRGSVPCPLPPADVTAKIYRALVHLSRQRPGESALSELSQYMDRHVRTHGRSLFSTYGGNTPCIEVRGTTEVTLVFDLGTGFRDLSNALIAAGESRGRHLVVFLTHLHLDHLLGLQLALVAYHPETTIHIYGMQRHDGAIGPFLAGVQSRPFWPVPLDQMGATFEFHDFPIDEGVIWSDDTPDGPVQVRACASPHPDGCVSYRVDGPGGAFVFATDREAPEAPDPDFEAFCRDVNLLIHDSPYTPEQYRGDDGGSRRGWGHSSYEMAVNAALDAQVGRLALFHHEPIHDDENLDRLWERAKAYMLTAAADRPCEPIPVEMAYDGAVWNI